MNLMPSSLPFWKSQKNSTREIFNFALIIILNSEKLLTVVEGEVQLLKMCDLKTSLNHGTVVSIGKQLLHTQHYRTCSDYLRSFGFSSTWRYRKASLELYTIVLKERTFHKLTDSCFFTFERKREKRCCFLECFFKILLFKYMVSSKWDIKTGPVHISSCYYNTPCGGYAWKIADWLILRWNLASWTSL